MNELEEVRDLYSTDSTLTPEIAHRARNRFDSFVRTGKKARARRPRWTVPATVGVAIAGVVAAIGIPVVALQPSGQGSEPAGGGSEPAGVPAGGKANQLTGRSFLSTEVDVAGQPNPLPPGENMYLVIEGDEPRLPGNDLEVRMRCGEIQFDIKSISDHRIRMKFNAATVCGKDDPEGWLTKFFESGPSYELDGSRLVLRSGDSRMAFNETNGKVVPALLGKRFESVEITEAGKPVELMDTPFTLKFDGRAVPQWGVTARAACGTVALIPPIEMSYGRIRSRAAVVPKVLAPPACGSHQKEQDAWLADLFEAEPGWKLADGKLILESGQIRVVLEEVEK